MDAFYDRGAFFEPVFLTRVVSEASGTFKLGEQTGWI